MTETASASAAEIDATPAAVASALTRAAAAVEAAMHLMSRATLQDWEGADVASAQHTLAQIRRHADAGLSRAASAIAELSRRELGAASLARKHGFKDPEDLIARTTGTTRTEAKRIIKAGEVLARQRRTPERDAGDAPQGSDASARRFPLVASAFESGEISVNAAGAITTMLDEVSSTATAEAIARSEKQLVRTAGHVTLHQLTQAIRRHRSILTRGTAAERAQTVVRDRALVLREENDGSVTIAGSLDPVSAAPVRAALDTYVSAALRARRDKDPLEVDDRTPAQMRADALATIATHMLGCGATSLPRTRSRVVVRIDADALRTGLGLGEVEGHQATVPASHLRALACDAGIVPVVLGGASEVLDVGRVSRDFSSAQRTALLERDGGCAMCGAPPSWCEAHHIEWWDRDGGRSDLANGVMLCVSCHHRVHQQPWEIDASATDVWFRPPGSVDARRPWRQGGRATFLAPPAHERPPTQAPPKDAEFRPPKDVEIKKGEPSPSAPHAPGTDEFVTDGASGAVSRARPAANLASARSRAQARRSARRASRATGSGLQGELNLSCNATSLTVQRVG